MFGLAREAGDTGYRFAPSIKGIKRELDQQLGETCIFGNTDT